MPDHDIGLQPTMLISHLDPVSGRMERVPLLLSIHKRYAGSCLEQAHATPQLSLSLRKYTTQDKTAQYPLVNVLHVSVLA